MKREGTLDRTGGDTAELVIAAILKKLEANRDVVGKSSYGRLSWRRSKGEIEIYLEPKL